MLDAIVAEHGHALPFLRFDNGPDFIAHAVADWCRFNGVDTVFTDPGSPWQNAWIESFDGRLRDELLNAWQFDSLLETRVHLGDWRIDDNCNRPDTTHGDLTPTEFADTYTINQPKTGLTPVPPTGSPSLSRQHRREALAIDHQPAPEPARRRPIDRHPQPPRLATTTLRLPNDLSRFGHDDLWTAGWARTRNPEIRPPRCCWKAGSVSRAGRDSNPRPPDP